MVTGGEAGTGGRVRARPGSARGRSADARDKWVAARTPPLQAVARVGARAGGEVRSIDDPRSQAYRRSLPRQPGLGRDAGSFASVMRLLGKFPRRQKSIAEPGSRGP